MPQIEINKRTAKGLIEIFDYMQQSVFDSRWHEEQEIVDQLLPVLKKIQEG